MAVKSYLLSMAAGVLVGIVYSLLGVRSPAPPVIALAGLFGMLVGEQVLPVTRRLLGPEPVTAAWVQSQCGEHVLGRLPASGAPAQQPQCKPGEAK
jgi:XapX domain-containing protein